MIKALKTAVSLMLSLAMCTVIASCGENKNTSSAGEAAPSEIETSVSVSVYKGEECVATAASTKEVSLADDTALKPNMKINVSISGSKYVFLKMGDNLEEALIYLPEGVFEYTVPDSNAAKAYPNGVWTSDINISARIPTDEQLKEEKNLALNPYDLKAQAQYYPHAEANSECRNEAAFLVRNAIDGFSQNTGHGDYPFESWGPEQITNPEMTVNFGREVIVNRVVIYIRADFPHDTYWNSGKIKFSDGTATDITLQKVSAAQAFEIGGVKTSSISLTELKGVMGWAGITEIQVFGTEAI